MGRCVRYLLLLWAMAARGQVFRLPTSAACQNRIVHRERFGKSYHFSWLAVGRDRKWTWEEARNYCRDFCMDSISISSRAENDWVKSVLRNNGLSYIWTGGRKCNFAGCERADLQPAIENGWYWAPTGQRMAPPASCPYCDWSRTGGLGSSQPDNREEKQGGRDEACVAILNNFYQVQSAPVCSSLLQSGKLSNLNRKTPAMQ